MRKLESIKKSWQQRRQIASHLSHIKHKIAVYSGKGGVGKTTVAVNLAVKLSHQGHTVGLLDADIDCPNVTKVLGIGQKPVHQNDGQVIPAEGFGVKVISMGFFQKDEEEAVIFRGPMIHNVITQFLQITVWGDLDYLVVDLPPGTSDSPLTIMQTLTPDGFVIVTTPQELAKLDARRSINMVKKLNLKILGIVENYTGEIFGSGGGLDLAQEMELPFLGSLGLRPDYRDSSKPTVLIAPEVDHEYEEIVSAMKSSLEAVNTSDQ